MSAGRHLADSLALKIALVAVRLVRFGSLLRFPVQGELVREYILAA